jgi:dTDP-glucose 4,6-dehydratase
MTIKNILVTGGAGFIGSNFIQYALEKKKNWRIVNLDKLTYAGNPANFQDMPNDMAARHELVCGDICDKTLLTNLFEKENFDGVIHFAAESHVDRSIVGPQAFVETNVNGTCNLLDVSLHFWKTKGKPDEFRFLHISTDEVYGSLGETGYFTETTPYDPSSPYSASKAAADHFVRAYFRTYNLPTLVTNCSNNYGPYQFPEKLIPLMMLNIMENKELPVYGDGKNVRDWLYVIDHCSALLKVFQQGKPGETYNIGGNCERQNIEIVNLLCDITDRLLKRAKNKSAKRLIKFVTDRPGHDRRYAIDSNKIKNELGWAPEHSLEEALESTVKWYMDHLTWVNSVKSGQYRKWIEKNYLNRDKPGYDYSATDSHR